MSTKSWKVRLIMKSKYLSNKSMAFLCNLIVVLLPVLVWDILLLFIVTGFIPSTLLNFIDPFIGLVLLISLLLTNSMIAATYGQTFGAITFNIKIVDSSGKPASKVQLFMRECIGFGIPFILLYKFTFFFGIAAYLIVNGLVILMDPQGRSLIDFILRTKTISGSQSETKIAQPQEVLKQFKKPEPVKKSTPAPIPVVIKPEVREKMKKNVKGYPVDLHMHSKYSDDGEFTVEELMLRARNNGVEIMSITDHNSVKANFEAVILAERVGIDYIPGIEIDCTYEGYDFHLLAYGINYKDERYIQLENFNLKQERKASIERVNKFEAATGLRLDVDALLASNATGVISGEMIGEQCLLNEEYNDLELFKPYREGGNRSDNPYVNIYWDFFAQGKIAHVPISFPTLKDMLELIKDTGGIPILAHPSKPFKERQDLIYSMLKEGVRGLEVFSSYHSNEEILNYLKIVKDTSCYVTCGSDFHGKTKPSIEIGESHASDRFDKLIAVFVNKMLN